MEMLCQTIVLQQQGRIQLNTCLIDIVGIGLTTAYSCLLFCLAIYISRIGYQKRSTNGKKFPGHYLRHLLITFLIILHIPEIGDCFVTLERRNISIRYFLVPLISLLAIFADIAFHCAIEKKALESFIGLEIGLWIMTAIWRLLRLVNLILINLSWDDAVLSFAVAFFAVLIVLALGDAFSLYIESAFYKKSFSIPETPTTEKLPEKPCYRHNKANAFSQMTFWWLNPLLWRGYKDPIEIEDLGSLPEEESVRLQFKKFNEIFKKEKINSKLNYRKPSLWKCFFEFIWPNYYWGGLYKLLGDCVGLVGPLGISVIIDYTVTYSDVNRIPVEENFFPTNKQLFSNGYIMGVIVFIAAIAQGTLSQCSTHLVNIEGIRLKSALQSLVYDKYMRMASWSNSDLSATPMPAEETIKYSEKSHPKNAEDKPKKSPREEESIDGSVITNLISEDSFNIMSFIWIGHYIWAIPLKIGVLMFLLYLKLGISAIIGATVCIFTMTPLQFYIGKKMSVNSKLTADRSDVRMMKINEVFQGIKILKMYGWETIYGNKIVEARDKELKLLNNESLYWALITFLTHASSVLITLVTFGLYFILEEGEMTPANVFAGLALFNQLTVPLFIFPVTVPIVISALVSTRRLAEFLELPEINHTRDEIHSISRTSVSSHTTCNHPDRGFQPEHIDNPYPLDNIEETEEIENEDVFKENASDKDSSAGSVEDYQTNKVENVFMFSQSVFVWGVGGDALSRITITESLKIPKGKMTMVVGKTGSGKSSFLSALIGEMNLLKGNMTRASNESLAYVSQSPWITNTTIRENILFGRAMRARRYRRVLTACALHADLGVHAARDQAPASVLSGGQRQRVALARALYSHAGILVLDDPFAALDHTVAQKVFEKGIRRACERDNRTVVMVTHRLQLLAQADQIIHVDNGRIRSVGTLSEVETSQPVLAREWRLLFSRVGPPDGLGLLLGPVEHTARGRWQLLRWASKVSRQLRDNNEPQDEGDGGFVPSFIPLKKRFSAFQGSKYFTHDLLLPTDECDDEMLRSSAPKRSSTRVRRGHNSCRVGSRKHKTAERSSSLQVTKHKVKPAPLLRQSSSPAIQFNSSGEVDSINSCTRQQGDRIQQRYLLRNLFPMATQKLIETPTDGSQITRQKSIIKRFLSRSSTKRKSAVPSPDREHTPIRRIISTNSAASDDFMDDEDFSTDNSTTDGLMTDEQREYGTIPKRVYLEYFKSCGIIAGTLYLVSSIAWQCLRVYTDVWLSEWTGKDSEPIEQGKISNDVTRYFTVYAVLSIVSIIMSFASNAIGQYAGALARKTLHAKLLENIILCPLSFFESTPLGRIINRFSTDIGIIDKKIATSIQRLLQFLFLCVSATLVNAVVAPWFLIIAIPICLLYYVIQKFYRCSARELQRLDAITKSPVFSHFGETLGGLSSIRAYGQQERFSKMLWNKMDINTNAFIILNSSNRWLGIALDYLGGVIVFAAINAALFSAKMYPRAVTPSLVGLAINYTLLVPIYLNWVVKFLSDVEMYMSAVERVQQYTSFPIEDYGATTATSLPEDWPSRGEVRFSGVTLKYGNSKEPVIQNFDLHVPAGQMVAICGRTGSGKSSLLLSILRMVDITEGTITVDGLDLADVPLRILRGRVASVPQEGGLFGGALRENLHQGVRLGDLELWEALEKAQLKQTVTAFPGGLDGIVAEGGQGWSVGERQQLCVARALLRPCSLLLMDEPTAAIDPATEAALLPALVNRGRTTITVAHRLSTILNYDRVIVMEEGKIVEDGSPKDLMARPMSIFSSMLRAAEE